MWELRSVFAIFRDNCKQIEADWVKYLKLYIRSDKGHTFSAFSILVEIKICLLIVHIQNGHILTN